MFFQSPDRPTRFGVLRCALLVLALSCSGSAAPVCQSVQSADSESETLVEDASEIFAGTRDRRLKQCRRFELVEAIRFAHGDGHFDSPHPFTGHRFGRNRLRNGALAPLLC
tara:strand:+ start:625444 stop:625776 length:333 start_codon:yes stop_codon:yes gene_type:complete